LVFHTVSLVGTSTGPAPCSREAEEGACCGAGTATGETAPHCAMPPTSPSDGPVIGGHTTVVESFAPPPPATGGGPGVGNASGLVLMLIISAAIGFAVFQHLNKLRKKSAMHSAAQKMANQLKAAALSGEKIAGKSKKKGPAGDKESTKFTPLGQDEDREDDADVEACGEPNSDDGSTSDGNSDVPRTCSLRRGAKGSGKVEKKRKEAKNKSPKEKQGGNAESGLSFGHSRPTKHEDAESAISLGFNDDASAINFGDPNDENDEEDKSCIKPRSHPNRSTQSFGYDDDNGNDDPGDDLVEHGIDDEDDIHPNDSVSNVGYSRPIMPIPPPRKACVRASAPPKGHRATAAMPSIGEQDDAEADEEHATPAPKSTKRRKDKVKERNSRGSPSPKAEHTHEEAEEDESSPRVMTLDELDRIQDNPLRAKRTTDDSDAFSVVHQAHLEMRKNIPQQNDALMRQAMRRECGDECRITLTSSQDPYGFPMQYDTEPTKARRGTGKLNHGAKPPLLFDDDDGDDSNDDDGAGSGVTFLAPPDSRALPIVPTAPPCDDGSDVDSDVSFNFNIVATSKTSAQKAKGRAEAERPKATKGKLVLSKKNAQEKPTPSHIGAVRTLRIKGLTAAQEEDEDEGESDEAEHEQDGKRRSCADDDDDDMTMVNLASRPRDPFLRPQHGMRGAGRYVGGGRVGLDGKWGSAGKLAHPSHRFDDADISI